MMISLKNIFSILLLFPSCVNMPHKSTAQNVHINAAKVYIDFEDRGYTTAGAFTHFDDMKEKDIAQLIVDNESKEKLEQTLSKAEKKKHYQTKHGGNLIFCELELSTDTQIHHRVIISGVGAVHNMFGKVKEERAVITDLTKMTDYKIKDPEDLKWLLDFREHMKNNERGEQRRN